MRVLFKVHLFNVSCLLINLIIHEIIDIKINFLNINFCQGDKLEWQQTGDLEIR